MNNINKSQGERLDVYTRVTNLIIEKLESGIIPWREILKTGNVPQNYISKRPYTSINAFLLGMEDYPQPFYMTFPQIKQLGGSVKKGAKGHIVVFKKVLEKKDKDSNIEKMAIMKNYHVFNISDVTGVDFVFAQNLNTLNNTIKNGETIIQNMPNCPKIVNDIKSQAFYSPALDYINIPHISQFLTSENYYLTLFHELTHSTGHKNRLNRFSETQEKLRFGSKTYAFEELVAEMGACFLAIFAKINDDSLFDNSTAYIQSWISKLKSDKYLIFRASTKAQHASEYIMNRPE